MNETNEIKAPKMKRMKGKRYKVIVVTVDCTIYRNYRSILDHNIDDDTMVGLDWREIESSLNSY